MVESTCFQHTSSHPDKYNNSVDREKIQGEILQSIFKYSGVSTNNTRTTSVSTRNPATPNNSAYRINSSTRNTTTTRLILCHPVQTSTRHLPATVPRVSKHSTWQNPPTALQALHTAQAGFQQFYPVETAF